MIKPSTRFGLFGVLVGLNALYIAAEPLYGLFESLLLFFAYKVISQAAFRWIVVVDFRLFNAQNFTFYY